MKRFHPLALLAALLLAAPLSFGPATAADKKPLQNSAGQIRPFQTGDTVAVANGGTGATTASAARTGLGVAVGTDVQAYDADLAAIAGVTSAADKVPYFTGSGTATVATFSAAGRAIVDDADAAAQRTTLGLGTFATQSAPTGSTQCLHADSSGVVTGTGSDCGAGGGGSITYKDEGSTLTSALTSVDCVGAGIACTNTSGAVTVTVSGGGSSSTILAPGGRLTLVTGTPVLTSDQTAKSQVYYTCFAHKSVPYYDGSTDQLDSIPSCEVSLTMATSGTGVTNSGGVFDIWWSPANDNICVATNGSGGGWASDTSGSNTARGTGYTQVHNTRGYWTNVNAIASCYNGTTNYGSLSAERATFLGTIYTTAAGQTGMAFKPTPASGGTNNILGVWNAYNRVQVYARSLDSGSDYSYTTATFRSANNSNSNRISWVDGLQQSAVRAMYGTDIFTSAPTTVYQIGVNFDSTSATPQSLARSSNTPQTSIVIRENTPPLLGFHFAQGVEAGNATGTASIVVTGSGYHLRVEADLMM